MFRQNKLKFFVAILISVLLIGQNVQSASAKTRAALKLQTVNGSVFDDSKNIVTIPKATGLSATVSVKPHKSTLKNGKAVKIEGELEDGNLRIDLANLGPANFIPKGKYLITATRGKKKVKYEYEYNPPQLLVGRIKVPVPDKTGDLKTRILRYQTTGEEVPADVVDVPPCEITISNAKHKLIEGAPTLQSEGQAIVNEEGVVEYNYQVVHEETADQVNPEDPNSYIAAKVEVPTSTGETASIILTAPVFRDNVNEASGSNNIGNVGPASTAASNIITTAYAELEKKLDSGELLPPLDKAYSSITKLLAPAIENANTQTFDIALKNIENALAVGSGNVAEAIFANANDQDVPLPPQDLSDVAAEVAWTAPNAINANPQDLAQDGASMLESNTFAVGYFDSSLLSIPPSEEFLANGYLEADAVPGSFQLPSEEKIKAALKAGSLPSTTINSAKALETFGKFIELAKQGGSFNPDQFMNFPIPPGIQANLGDLAGKAQGLPFTGVSFQCAPGSFPQFTGAPTDLGSFMVFAYPGAFMPPALGDIAEIAAGQYEGAFPSGFVAPSETSGGRFTASFIPPTFAENFSGGNFGIFGSKGIEQNLSGNVFALPPASPGSSSFAPTASGVQFFDPSNAAHSQALTGAFAQNGDQFGQAASALSFAFNHGSSPGGGAGGLSLPPPSGLSGLFGAATAGLSGAAAGFNFGPVMTFDPAILTGALSSPSGGIFAGGKDMGGATGGTFPGGGATGGTFPGGGATGGTFPGGMPPTGGTFPGGGATGGDFPGTGTGSFMPPPTGGTGTGSFGGMPPTGGTGSFGGMPPTGGTGSFGGMPPPTGSTGTGSFMPPPTGGTGSMPPPTGSFTPPPSEPVPLAPPPMPPPTEPAPTYTPPPSEPVPLAPPPMPPPP